MTELVDRSIASLRHHHDDLAEVVAGLGEDQLTGPSGASEWTVAQVLSHLGSGSEISLHTFRGALDGTPADQDNQAIWARWDGSTPSEQAAGFLEHDERLVATLEGLTPDQRETLTVDLGFLPEPVPVLVALGMRLNEVANHAWDVRVAVDPDAEVDAEASELLAGQFADGLAFLLDFVAKPAEISQPTTLRLDGHSVVIEDDVRVEVGVPLAPTAELTGPLGAAIRLLSGRLRPEHTPQGVEVKGNVSLDDLRKVFPGY